MGVDGCQLRDGGKRMISRNQSPIRRVEIESTKQSSHDKYSTLSEVVNCNNQFKNERKTM